jgi:hypothetical protein
MSVDTVAWLIYGSARPGREEEVELWDCQHLGGFQAPSNPDRDPRKTLSLTSNEGCGPLVAAKGSPASKWALETMEREFSRRALREGETQVPRYR